MSKQDPYRFNLRFDDTDKDHRKVCDFLNTCGRKKTRYYNVPYKVDTSRRRDCLKC